MKNTWFLENTELILKLTFNGVKEFLVSFHSMIKWENAG